MTEEQVFLEIEEAFKKLDCVLTGRYIKKSQAKKLEKHYHKIRVFMDCCVINDDEAK